MNHFWFHNSISECFLLGSMISGLHAKLPRAILAQGPVNIVEGWLEYIRPQARIGLRHVRHVLYG
ncbi:hypothetical protein Prudu_015689 [Prunus dulcis]|uniref:Uncharacterized protein n=1 Tax=Prunus dulcis TaxID=3755 RepID=A0A4Y1RJW2_PRUDU|nr:hypothetical protein Prudu_015689 [Prunus dulcis]